MEVDGADTRYQDLPLGNLGVFCEVNEKRRIRVIFPKLTSQGDVEYIYSWHDLKSIHIPDFEKNQKSRVNFKTAQQLAFLIKEHIQFVEPEIFNLEKQWDKINELLDLVATSELYAGQQEIYERALFQVENLLNKAEELRQVYVRFIREVLIGRKIAGYNPHLLPDDSLAIDDQYKRIKEEYEYMKEFANRPRPNAVYFDADLSQSEQET
ncbi:MAG: hypothetical protein AAFO04_29435, partial [Cyanobacteria bacterium J06592_8]